MNEVVSYVCGTIVSTIGAIVIAMIGLYTGLAKTITFLAAFMTFGFLMVLNAVHDNERKIDRIQRWLQ